MKPSHPIHITLTKEQIDRLLGWYCYITIGTDCYTGSHTDLILTYRLMPGLSMIVEQYILTDFRMFFLHVNANTHEHTWYMHVSI